MQHEALRLVRLLEEVREMAIVIETQGVQPQHPLIEAESDRRN